MSPRQKNLRKLLELPKTKGFNPFGSNVNVSLDPVYLLLEEYEALKLCDYDQLTHHQAAVEMNVSRPTFTRIYASTRKKLAKAFVEGRSLLIEGGKVYFDSTWYHCQQCNCHFNNPEMHTAIESCPLCGSDRFKQVVVEEDNCNSELNSGDSCICPNCGYEKKHQFGNPCMIQICPECNTAMKRKTNNN